MESIKKPPFPLSPRTHDGEEAKGGSGGGETPLGYHFGSKGRANFPKLPEQSATENSPADTIKTANGRTQRCALSRIAEGRANGRARRRPKRAADHGVAHDIALIAVIAGIALYRRSVSRLWVVGAIGRLVMRHSWSLMRVHVFFNIDMAGLMVMAITAMGTFVMPEMFVMVVPVSVMAVRMAVRFIGTIVVVARHGPVGFVHRVTVGPVIVAGLSRGTHS